MTKQTESPPGERRTSRVAVVKTNGDNNGLTEAVRSCVALTGGLDDLVTAGARVLLKPNMVAPLRRGVTDFGILRAVIELVREADGVPFIGEFPGLEFDSDKTFEVLGLTDFARDMDVELVNFEHDEPVQCPVRFGPVRQLDMPRSAMEADVVINLPRLKYHGLTTVTLGVKNIMGVAKRNARHKIHVFGLHRGLAWLATLLKSHLTIVDGTKLTQRPVFGEETRLDTLLASRDVLAVDKVACRLLDVDPTRVPHLRHAEEMGLFCGPIELVGDGALPEEGTGGRVGFRKRLLRAAYWLSYGVDYLGKSVADRSYLSSLHVRFGAHPVIDTSICNECGDCIRVCPVDAIDVNGPKIIYDRCKAVRCMRCFEVCPTQAIRIKGLQKVQLGPRTAGSDDGRESARPRER